MNENTEWSIVWRTQSRDDGVQSQPMSTNFMLHPFFYCAYEGIAKAHSHIKQVSDLHFMQIKAYPLQYNDDGFCVDYMSLEGQ